MPTVRHPDPFNVVLLSSPPLNVTTEQKDWIKKVLDKACSDSRFADKAYLAIVRILLGMTTLPPVVTSLTPNSAEIGDPSFTIHVHGTGFKNTDVIVFAGQEEPTTFVGPTELTTGVNMDVWLGPDALPVAVLSAEGVLSDAVTFTFTDGSVVLASVGAKIPHVVSQTGPVVHAPEVKSTTTLSPAKK